jgi:propionyl-CoA synthetase
MVPLGLLVLKAGVTRDSATIAEEVAQRIREEIGPIAACRAIVVLDKLPKTRSGKVLRSVIRKIADGESFDTPPTIEDPHALELVRAALSAAGYNRREVFHAAQS